MKISTEQPQKVTLIVGAGVTGLTTGYQLSKNGKKVLIVEKEDSIGGLSRSLELDGIRFDFGPHVFLYTPFPECDRFILDTLKNEPLITSKFQFAIHAENRYWKFPNQLMVPFYPWKYKKEILACLLNQAKVQGDPDSLKHWISGKSGIAFYKDLFENLFLKKTLMPGGAVHKDWYLRADRNIFNKKEPMTRPPFYELVKMQLSKMKSSKLYYPENGFERFVQCLWDEFTDFGGETILKCGPLSFEQEQDRIKSVWVKGRKHDVESVIWTGSVNELNTILGAEEVPKLKYVTIYSVYLTYEMDKNNDRPFVYTYHPDPDLIFNRIYYPRNIFKKKSPIDKEGINLEFNLSDDKEKMGDDEIIARCVQDIQKLGLYPEEKLRQHHIVKLNKIMPVYSLDYEKEMKAAFLKIHQINNLFSIGRQGGYYFCLSPNAVFQGLKMADHLLAHQT